MAGTRLLLSTLSTVSPAEGSLELTANAAGKPEKPSEIALGSGSFMNGETGMLLLKEAPKLTVSRAPTAKGQHLSGRMVAKISHSVIDPANLVAEKLQIAPAAEITLTDPQFRFDVGAESGSIVHLIKNTGMCPRRVQRDHHTVRPIDLTEETGRMAPKETGADLSVLLSIQQKETVAAISQSPEHGASRAVICADATDGIHGMIRIPGKLELGRSRRPSVPTGLPDRIGMGDQQDAILPFSGNIQVALHGMTSDPLNRMGQGRKTAEYGITICQGEPQKGLQQRAGGFFTFDGK